MDVRRDAHAGQHALVGGGEHDAHCAAERDVFSDLAMVSRFAEPMEDVGNGRALLEEGRVEKGVDREGAQDGRFLLEVGELL